MGDRPLLMKYEKLDDFEIINICAANRVIKKPHDHSKRLLEKFVLIE